MRRYDAKLKAQKEPLTVGELRARLNDAKFNPDVQSRLNPGLTKGQVWKVLYDAIGEASDDYVVRGLLLQNYYREFE